MAVSSKILVPAFTVIATLSQPALPSPEDERLPDQAVYAVFAHEQSTMTRIFDGSRSFCISVANADPSPYLFSRLKRLYEGLRLSSRCDNSPTIEIDLVDVIDEHTIRVSFDCYNFCNYKRRTPWSFLPATG